MVNVTGSPVTRIRLQAIKLRITMSALTSGVMPKFSSSIFRGMWGREIRKRTCMYPDLSCEKCSYMRNCAYGSTFEPISEVFAPEFTFQARYLSPPLVIEAPFFDEGKWEEDQEKQLDLILFGENSSYARYFVDRLQFIGEEYGVGSERVKFIVNKIEQVSGEGDVSQVTLDQLKDDQVYENWWEWKEPIEKVNQILIHIQTPVRLLRAGKLLRSLDMEAFIQTCLRRTEYLYRLYGESKNVLSKEELNELISSLRCNYSEVKWEDWHRYSSKQQKTMNLGGVVGIFQLQGNLKKLIPYLECGAFSHIGKQTVFGLGKYQVWVPLK